jgi:hypothetical protein
MGPIRSNDVRSVCMSPLLSALIIACGCAGSSGAPRGPEEPAAALARSPAPTSAPARPASCDAPRDRAAILSMAGTFAVSFAFDETEPLAPGYMPRAAYRANATEHVAVLEQAEHRVVLQHVLLIEKHSGALAPMKHWRQDWTFEDRELFEYRGDRTWERRTLSEAEARCSWSQAVFEVDDGPRYESYGHFAHDAAAARSTWVSASTWRPLPRREYTVRNDYDVLVAENRHVMTARGWLHEQDNLKQRLEEQRVLVRERGVNRYVRVSSPTAASLAASYLTETGAFWATVRAEWLRQFARGPSIRVQQELSGTPLHEPLFALAAAQQGASPELQRAKVHELIARYVEPIASDPRSAGLDEVVVHETTEPSH